MKDLPVYKSYISGKKTKRRLIAKGHRAKECLKLVHTNVYGTFGVYIWK